MLMMIVYSEDMEIDHTIFSPLTQGWNEDPDSVIDSQGSCIFNVKTLGGLYKRYQIRSFGLQQARDLADNGLVMLDHKDIPLRDVPGLPLTLQTEAPAWL